MTNCYRNSKKNYAPEENIAIDEYLSLWKGRLFFRVYIPSKRERYIIKIFILYESKTCFLSNFIMYYIGFSTDYVDCQNIVLPRMNNRNLPSSSDDYISPSKVVLTYRFITDGAISKKRVLHYPRQLLLILELANVLLNLQTNYHGTLQKREGLPKDFWNWKPMKGTPPKKGDEAMKAR